MKNYIEQGDFLHTVLDATVKGGDLVILNDAVGVAVTDGKGVDLQAVAVNGVFEFAKAPATAIAQGKKCYFIVADKTVTTTASGNTFIGLAWESAEANGSKIRVKIG